MKTTTTQDTGEQLAAMGYALAASSPRGEIDGDGWPHIAYTVTLSRHGREIIITPYRLGVGHVRAEDWGAALRHEWRLSASTATIARTLKARPGAQLADKLAWARAAAEVAGLRKIAPTLPDVLHSLLLDGAAQFDNLTFEDWAGEYGYDPDSRKAEAIFDTCVEIGRKLAQGIPGGELETLKEILADH
jgi:hypothetical protein